MLHIWDPRDGDFVSFRGRDEMFDGKRMVGKVWAWPYPRGRAGESCRRGPGGGQKTVFEGIVRDSIAPRLTPSHVYQAFFRRQGWPRELRGPRHCIVGLLPSCSIPGGCWVTARILASGHAPSGRASARSWQRRGGRWGLWLGTTPSAPAEEEGGVGERGRDIHV